MLFGFGTEMVQVWRGGEEIGEPWLQVKGKVENRSFSFISSTERVVATVSRKGINMTDVYAEKDTCVLRVEPGVDATLMVFLAVALFQKHRDYDNGTGLKSFLRGFV